MDRAAKEIMQFPVGSTNIPNRCTGAYAARGITRFEWGIRFVTIGNFVDLEGFAYRPDGPPLVIGPDNYRHFSGPWYIWVERF